MKKPAAFLTAVAFGLLPKLALACPACAGRSDANPYLTFTLLSSFVLLPFGVSAVVLRIVRRAEIDDAAFPQTGVHSK